MDENILAELDSLKSLEFSLFYIVGLVTIVNEYSFIWPKKKRIFFYFIQKIARLGWPMIFHLNFFITVKNHKLERLVRDYTIYQVSKCLQYSQRTPSSRMRALREKNSMFCFLTPINVGEELVSRKFKPNIVTKPISSLYLGLLPERFHINIV